MSNNVLEGFEGRKALKKGIDKTANVVKSTLGAKGKNVFIAMTHGYPQTTKDGVTVARAINLKEPVEKMGSEIIKEVCEKTVMVSGDGTTTAATLTQSIITLGMDEVEAGRNAVDLKSGIDKATVSVVGKIKELSKEIVNNEMLNQIATISANNDTVIGGLIAEGYELVGKDGLIATEQGSGYESKIRKVEGMEFGGGYHSHFFVTDQNKMKCEMANPYILIYGGELKSMKPLLPLVEQVFQTGKPFLIICPDLEGEALATLVVNKMQNGVKICAVKPPSFGMNQKLQMEDIAFVTGGVFITEDLGMKLENTTLAELGRAEKIVVDSSSCKIIGGAGDLEKIKERVEGIKELYETTQVEYDKASLKERLSKMGNGVAVLSIGGVTESEIKEKKDRIEDALCATKAANEEGFVAGGGTTFLKCIEVLDELKGDNEDENEGIEIIKKAIQEPFKQILNNGGVKPDDYIKDIIKSEYGLGFNIKNNKLENLFDAGVIDPTKVLRVALENSASIASLFLITEGVIYPELPKE